MPKTRTYERDDYVPFTYGKTRDIPPPPGTPWLLRGLALFAAAVLLLAVARTALSVLAPIL